MQPCLNTSCFCSPFERSPISLPDKLRQAADIGYQWIELWNNELSQHEAEGGTLADIKAMLDDLGLKVPSVITCVGWMGSDGEAHRQALEECRQRMAQAAAIGAPRIVATPDPVSQPQWYDLNLDRTAAEYRELLDLGAEFGVDPMMEFLGFCSSVYQLEQAMAVVELAGSPRATVVLDPFHLWRGGSGFRRLGSVPAERIGICHFNDAPANDPPRFEQRDADRVYPAEGDLPLADMLRTLADNGYDGPLSLELFNPEYWAMPTQDNLRQGYDLMRAVMDEAGVAA